jgi:hypothetical protein
MVTGPNPPAWKNHKWLVRGPFFSFWSLADSLMRVLVFLMRKFWPEQFLNCSVLPIPAKSCNPAACPDNTPFVRTRQG